MGKTNRWLDTVPTAIDDGFADDMPDFDMDAALQRILDAEDVLL